MREKKLIALQEALAEILKLLKPIIIGLKSNDNFEYFHLSLLERYVSNFEAIHHLIPLYTNDKSIINAISPILRMGLADFISQGYVLSILDYQNEDEYMKRVDQILYSPITREVKELEKKKKNGEIDHSELKNGIKAIYNFCNNAFSEFKDNPFSYELKIKNDIAPAKMSRKMCENRKFAINSVAYNLYDYYSKIEHFGILSNFFYGLEYRNEKLNTDRFIHSIIFHCKGVEFSLNNLIFADKENVISKFELIGHRFIKAPLHKHW